MEANSCPKVVVADLDTKPFQHRQTVHVRQVPYKIDVYLHHILFLTLMLEFKANTRNVCFLNTMLPTICWSLHKYKGPLNGKLEKGHNSHKINLIIFH